MEELLLSQAYSTLGADVLGAFSMVALTVAGLGVVVWDAFRNNAPGIPWLCALALGVGLVWEVTGLGTSGTAFYGMIRVGGFASFINIVILGSALLSIILSVPYLKRLRHHHGEVYALILFATVGMLLLATANNLVAVFVGLETMSICLYVLTGLVREDERATESALKYFLLGAFSTGFFLYGIALLYGATGTMYLPEMGEGLLRGNVTMFWAGVALLLIGFLFKVSAVPFHMWTPDVYQGAPTTLTGFMSTASKASAFGSLILVLYYALPAVERWSLVLAVVALITMILGNVLAVSQANVKRMLAYSSIAHAGYVLTGLAAGTPEGYAGALFYLLVYSVMNIGAFGVIALLEWDDRAGSEQTLASLAGVGHRRPLLGVTMAFFMFSLTGFPPLGGFLGKYAVFAPAVDAGLTWLALVGVLTSAIGAYYYLRVLYVLWMAAPEDTPEAAKAQGVPALVPASSAAVLVFCAALLLLLGVLPGLLEVTQSFFLEPVLRLGAVAP